MSILKGLLSLFDVATGAILLALLTLARQHMGWIVAYAWSPLVLKEFANSGHLDSIAVCLATAAIAAALGAMSPSCRAARHHGTILFIGAFALLALGVGAKLYPVVLLPLFIFFAVAARGWTIAAIGLIVFAMTTGLVLLPMITAQSTPLREPAIKGTHRATRLPMPKPALPDFTDSAAKASSPAGFATTDFGATDSLAGLRAFLSRWEMNDFLFLIVVENLKPTDGVPESARPWFSVVPGTWRQALVSPVSQRLRISPSAAAFLLTRLLTLAIFGVLALRFAWHAAKSRDAGAFLESAFLTLAWFWLLLPTQNPWYWIWALPLVPFARSRIWFAVGGLVFFYYLRFWLSYHFPTGPTLGTSYSGTQYFDFVVTWIEFAPWFLMLMVSGWGEEGSRTSTNAPVQISTVRAL